MVRFEAGHVRASDHVRASEEHLNMFDSHGVVCSWEGYYYRGVFEYVVGNHFLYFCRLATHVSNLWKW